METDNKIMLKQWKRKFKRNSTALLNQMINFSQNIYIKATEQKGVERKHDCSLVVSNME